MKQQAQKDPVQMLKESAEKMHIAACALVKSIFHIEEIEKPLSSPRKKSKKYTDNEKQI